MFCCAILQLLGAGLVGTALQQLGSYLIVKQSRVREAAATRVWKATEETTRNFRSRRLKRRTSTQPESVGPPASMAASSEAGAGPDAPAKVFRRRPSIFGRGQTGEARRAYFWSVTSGVIVPIVLLILLGMAIGMGVEGWSPVVALYWSTTTITTTGYGDYSPETSLGRGLTVVYLLVAVTVLSQVVSHIRAWVASARVHSRQALSAPP